MEGRKERRKEGYPCGLVLWTALLWLVKHIPISQKRKIEIKVKKKKKKMESKKKNSGWGK